MKRLLQTKPLFVTGVLYTILLTWGSLTSISATESPFQLSDKVLHIVAYFGLTLIWFFWKYITNRDKHNTQSRSKMVWIIAFFACVYGIIIEILQGQFTDDRIADIGDVIANTLGIVLAVILISMLNKKGILLKLKF